MDELLNMLKVKDVTKSAMSEYKRLEKANLIVIDDIMLFPVEKPQAVSLFNFINQLYENTSFIITTNKMPADWAKLLDDEVVATALLDRLLYHCEIINLTGKELPPKKTVNQFLNPEIILFLCSKVEHVGCHFLCTLVAESCALLIAKNCAVLFTDYTG